MITQPQVLERLLSAHTLVAELLEQLSVEQKEQMVFDNGWTVKDVMAHLAAWNWEALEEIGRILQDKGTWHELFMDKGKAEAFNGLQIGHHQDESLSEVVAEWKESCQALLFTVEQLTSKEWSHVSEGQVWQFGSLKDQPLSVWSLFEYGDTSHEAGYVEEMRKAFGL